MMQRNTDVAARRPLAFLAVASGGLLLQTITVVLLTHGSSVMPELATAIAVEIAVLHNFFWHERWTWGDRAAAHSRLRRFGAYQLATGSTSLAGNLLVVAAAVRLFAIDVTSANVIAVVVMSIANYTIADRWIFRRTAIAAVVALAVPSSAGAQPTRDTVNAWDAHIARLERNMPTVPAAPVEPGAVQGRELRIPGGLIHEWAGAVTIPGITVSQLVDALTTPGTPPPQDDVLESRVLEKSGDTLRVYLKLQRTAVITVIYDSEHAVRFERQGPALATSRSVATSIREAGGGDRGFLWRLNSYWTYRQIGSGVQVDVLSVSLSRDVPVVASRLVSPIASRIARESLRRTLEAMRLFGVSICRSQTPTMSFFVTSATSVTGNLGGLRGADALCQSLATAAGAGAKTWRAYLSVGSDADNGNRATDARSRIGNGPWVNAAGITVAGTLPSCMRGKAMRRCSSTSTADGSTVNGPVRRRPCSTTSSPARTPMAR